MFHLCIHTYVGILYRTQEFAQWIGANYRECGKKATCAFWNFALPEIIGNASNNISQHQHGLVAYLSGHYHIVSVHFPAPPTRFYSVYLFIPLVWSGPAKVFLLGGSMKYQFHHVPSMYLYSLPHSGICTMDWS